MIPDNVVSSDSSALAPPRPGWLLILMLLAVVLRIYFETVYLDFEADKARQLVVAECLAQGNGFCWVTADLDDLAADERHPVIYWPVGYPALVYLLDLLCDDLVLSSVVLDGLGVLLLLAACLGLLSRLRVSARGRGLFLLFTAFTFVPYIHLGSTDLLSAALYLLALALALSGVVDRAVRMRRFVAVGLLLFLAAFLRYAYYPMIGVIPFCLVVAGIASRDFRAVRAALVTGIAAFVPLCGLLVFSRLYFGVAMLVKRADATYPSNLLHTFPFPAEALFLTQLFEKNLDALFTGGGDLVRPAALLLSVLILALVAAPLVARLSRRTALRAADPAALFHLLAVATIAATAGMLCYYSYRNPPQTDWTAFFTHVQEPRYYVVAMLLIQVSLVFSVDRREPGLRFLRPVAGALLVLALLITVAYGPYRMYKVHVRGDRPEFAERERVVGAAIAKMRELSGDRLSGVVFADATGYHNTCLVALRTDARIVLDENGLLAGPLEASRPVTLFLRMSNWPTSDQAAFVAANGGQRVLAADGWSLYRFLAGGT